MALVGHIFLLNILCHCGLGRGKITKGCHLRQGPSQQVAQFEGPLAELIDAMDRLNGQEGVSTEFKEGLTSTDGTDMQELTPNSSHDSFGRIVHVVVASHD